LDLKKEMGFERKWAQKTCPKKKIKHKLGRVYTNLLSLTHVNSVKIVKQSDLTKNRVYLRVNMFFAPKIVNLSDFTS